MLEGGEMKERGEGRTRLGSMISFGSAIISDVTLCFKSLPMQIKPSVSTEGGLLSSDIKMEKHNAVKFCEKIT